MGLTAGCTSNHPDWTAASHLQSVGPVVVRAQRELPQLLQQCHMAPAQPQHPGAYQRLEALDASELVGALMDVFHWHVHPPPHPPLFGPVRLGGRCVRCPDAFLLRARPPVAEQFDQVGGAVWIAPRAKQEDQVVGPLFFQILETTLRAHLPDAGS